MAQGTGFAGRVVVGFDGSQHARTAVAWAAGEAAIRGRGLTIVTAVMPPVTMGGIGVDLPPGPELLQHLQSGANEQLATLADSLGAADVRTEMSIGGPSGVLLEASESADLIVLGSRGHGGFRNLLVGSVGAQVAAHAACPVVVLRRPPSTDAHEIVVGIDATPGSQSALAFAFDEASRHGWGLVAVHAWDVPAYDLLIVPNGPVPVPLADVSDSEIRMSAEVLAGFRTEYPDVEVQEHLVHGPAVQSIIDASVSAAMIVVGTRGHMPAVSALIGSVSNGVLHKSTVPVAVVPRVQPPAEAA